MTEDEVKQFEENRDRILQAILILLNSNDKGLAEDLYRRNQLWTRTPYDSRISEQDVQIIIADLALREKSYLATLGYNTALYRITGISDGKTCNVCSEWKDEIVAMFPDGKHRTVQDFINNHGFHINCRCSLEALKQ